MVASTCAYLKEDAGVQVWNYFTNAFIVSYKDSLTLPKNKLLNFSTGPVLVSYD